MDSTPQSSRPTRRKVGSLLLVAIAPIWIALLLIGSRTLLNYEATPGTPAAAPAQWPVQSRLARPVNTYTLVMFVHPNCPCTRASIAELAILMTRLQGRLAARVLISMPGASEAYLRSSDNWKDAAAIPGVTVSFDAEGHDAALFGAEVSGQTMVYDTEGKLLFTGGITAARGHQGDNEGVDAIVHVVSDTQSNRQVSERAGKQAAAATTSAYGCSLRNPNAAALRGDPSWRKQ